MTDESKQLPPRGTFAGQNVAGAIMYGTTAPNPMKAWSNVRNLLKKGGERPTINELKDRGYSVKLIKQADEPSDAEIERGMRELEMEGMKSYTDAHTGPTIHEEIETYRAIREDDSVSSRAWIWFALSIVILAGIGYGIYITQVG